MSKPEPLRNAPPPTAGEALRSVGRALYDGEADWQARLARALGVDRDTIRQWQRPKTTFGPDQLDRLMALAERRAGVRAREELREWLARSRP
jgi:hypothetical protein